MMTTTSVPELKTIKRGLPPEDYCALPSADFTLTVERMIGTETYEVEVGIKVTELPRKGCYYGPPEKCYPDEPGDYEVIYAFLHGDDGDTDIEDQRLENFELTSAEDDEAQVSLWDDDDPDDYDDYDPCWDEDYRFSGR